MSLFTSYIKNIRASGRRYFTIEEGVHELGIPKNNLLSCIYRLKNKGELFSPAKGLYIIIPPEYHNLGSIPAEQLVPILMKYRKIDYYAGLSTAAMYHGASHQKLQTFQIVTDRQITRNFVFGKIKIDCIYKKHVTDSRTQDVVVETGYLKISTPEVTIMDLLLYPNRTGGLNHIATILSELIEAVDIDKLLRVMANSKEKAWVQRLGYILDNIETFEENKKELLLNKLQNYLTQEKIFYCPLASEGPILGASYCKKWMIIENTKIESDL